MMRFKKRTILILATSGFLVPSAVLADIVFDPTNFVEAVQQVTQEMQLVEQFKQQVQNEIAMVKSWNYTQLTGILQNMNVWQQVFGQAGTTYSSNDPGATLNQQYPDDPNSYSGMSDGSIASMEDNWNREAREVLVENRTVQNDTYQSFQSTAQRIGQYVDHSNAAPGATAAMQAGNEELATLVAQLQTLQAQEITDARGETERIAQEQAEEAYGEQQRLAVRGGWASPAAPSSSLANAFSLADQ